MTSIEKARNVKELLRRALKIGEDFGYVYEVADTDDITGRIIHNLTITWLEPGDPNA